MFKPSSRFAILSEDINNNTNNRNNSNNRNSNNYSSNSNNSNNNNYSSNSNNYSSNNRNNYFKDNSCKKYFNNKKENEGKPIQSILNITLSEENFPKLINITENTTNNGKTYLNMLKTSKIIKKEEKKEIIKPGWIKLKLQPKTRAIIITTSPFDNEINEYNKIQEEAFSVLDALVNLHEKRTNEYINNWGYDEWEKMFIFPNYDYDYFDRLDEIEQQEFEEELEKERLKEIDEEFTTYYEYNN